MWLNQYLRQDSEKEKSLQQQQQLAMEAGVHYDQMVANQGQIPGSPGVHVQQGVGYDPHHQNGQSYRDGGTSPIHEMPPHFAGHRFNFNHAIRQDSILSVVSDIGSPDYESSITSPTSIVCHRDLQARDRLKSVTSAAESEFMDNEVNETKNHLGASSSSIISSPRTVNMRCYICSILILGILMFGLSLAFTLTFVTWHQNKRDSLLLSQHSCVVCDNLKISTDPLDDFRSEFNQRWDHGVLLCCADNATQFEKLLNVVSQSSV